MFPDEVDNSKIAEKLGMPIEHVNDILDVYFSDIKDKLANLEYSKVYIPNFGKFEACRNPLIRFVESIKKKHHSATVIDGMKPLDEARVMLYNNAIGLLGEIENERRDRQRRKFVRNAKKSKDEGIGIWAEKPTVQEEQNGEDVQGEN